LPSAQVPAPSRSAHAPGPPPRAETRLRIVIADDKKDVVDSLAMLLQLEGHEVHVAYSGEEALELARRVRPDAAVLDLSMPGRTGFEVCRALRAEPWGRRMKLIAQTGWGSPEHRARSREAGFDHHIVKPVEPVELITLLSKPPDRES